MGKGMSLGMIQMYDQLLDDEFRGLIMVLEARTDGIKPLVERQVKKELGVYDLMAKQAALEAQLNEVKNQLKEMLVSNNRYDPQRGWRSVVDTKLSERLNEINTPLGKARTMLASLKKSIKLASSPPEVASMFAKLPAQMEELRAEAKSLPPVGKMLGLSPKELKELEKLPGSEGEE